MATQQIVEKFIRVLSNQMVSYVRVKYGCPNFDPIVQVTFAANRRFSRGGIRNGKAFFNIVAKRFLSAAQATGMMNEIEYKSFNNDPVIGGLYNVTWKKAAASLVAHELAHSVQYDNGTKIGAKRVFGIEELDDRNDILRGHDWFWKRIYADLRIKFVNDNQFELDSPAILKPVEQTPKVVKTDENKPTVSSSDSLYVKYAYKGNSTIARFYINQKLAAVVVEINRQFYKADEFGEIQEKLPFTTLVEARRFLIGQ